MSAVLPQGFAVVSVLWNIQFTTEELRGRDEGLAQLAGFQDEREARAFITRLPAFVKAQYHRIGGINRQVLNVPFAHTYHEKHWAHAHAVCVWAAPPNARTAETGNKLGRRRLARFAEEVEKWAKEQSS